MTSSTSDWIFTEAEMRSTPSLRDGMKYMDELVLRRDHATLGRRGFVDARARHAQLDHAGFLEIIRRDVATAGHTMAPEPGWPRLVPRLGADDLLVYERQEIVETAAAEADARAERQQTSVRAQVELSEAAQAERDAERRYAEQQASAEAAEKAGKSHAKGFDPDENPDYGKSGKG